MSGSFGVAHRISIKKSVQHRETGLDLDSTRRADVGEGTLTRLEKRRGKWIEGMRSTCGRNGGREVPSSRCSRSCRSLWLLLCSRLVLSAGPQQDIEKTTHRAGRGRWVGTYRY